METRDELHEWRRITADRLISQELIDLASVDVEAMVVEELTAELDRMARPFRPEPMIERQVVNEWHETPLASESPLRRLLRRLHLASPTGWRFTAVRVTVSAYIPKV